MKLFIDTANIEEIREVAKWGILSGVTTNPSLIAKEGRNLKDVINEIVLLVDGPISAEVDEDTPEKMYEQGLQLAKIHPNVTIKIPMTKDGLAATRMLANKGINVNVTLIFTASQALLAARAGAKFVSPFIGRMDDAYGEGPGIALIENIAAIFQINQIETEIIAASIRGVRHVEEAALVGAHIATIPYRVLTAMLEHPLTTKGLQIFKDAKSK